ncbi:hypothetical protein [Roseivivax isoporae]|nr:hypothetical protein [Roseivivax isoporae]
MPIWPASVPFFTAASAYRRRSPEGNVLRTEMEYGPPKRRRRTSSAPARFEGAIRNLDLALLAVFESFHAETLLDGALSFTATDPLTGETRTYAFAGPYTVEPYRKIACTVSAQLEILS